MWKSPPYSKNRAHQTLKILRTLKNKFFFISCRQSVFTFLFLSKQAESKRSSQLVQTNVHCVLMYRFATLAFKMMTKCHYVLRVRSPICREIWIELQPCID